MGEEDTFHGTMWASPLGLPCPLTHEGIGVYTPFRSVLNKRRARSLATNFSFERVRICPEGFYIRNEVSYIRAKNPTLQDSPPEADRFRGIFLFRRSTPFRWGRPCDNCFLFDRGSEGIFYQIRKNLQNYG